MQQHRRRRQQHRFVCPRKAARPIVLRQAELGILWGRKGEVQLRHWQRLEAVLLALMATMAATDWPLGTSLLQSLLWFRLGSWSASPPCRPQRTTAAGLWSVWIGSTSLASMSMLQGPALLLKGNLVQTMPHLQAAVAALRLVALIGGRLLQDGQSGLWSEWRLLLLQRHTLLAAELELELEPEVITMLLLTTATVTLLVERHSRQPVRKAEALALPLLLELEPRGRLDRSPLRQLQRPPRPLLQLPQLAS